MSIDSSDEQDRLHAEAMRKLQAERRALMATRTIERGLLIVLTGDGKGKSSSAFGMVARALGWDMRVGVVQFIKGKWQTGEKRFFRRFPDLVTFEVMGEGFSWDVQDRQRDIAAAESAWQRSRDMIQDPAYDFVLLDELNIALRNGYLSVDDVVAFLRERPLDKHVCVTGRDAPAALIEIAELVTEMTIVKHPFQAGFKAQRGVEF
jgi:cob(I)alamin adenosyltransferase